MLLITLTFGFTFQVNGQRYPTVSKMFRDYYSIQGSSVPCECAFSGIPDVLKPTRMSIKPAHVRMHMELKSWLRPENESIFKDCINLEQMLEREGQRFR